MLAQIEKGIDIGAQQLNVAAQFGPFVWMVGLIVVLMSIRWCLVFHFIDRPRAINELEAAKVTCECLKSLTDNLTQMRGLFAELQGDTSGLFKYVTNTSPDAIREHIAEQQQLSRDDSWREERTARRTATGHA